MRKLIQTCHYVPSFSCRRTRIWSRVPRVKFGALRGRGPQQITIAALALCCLLPVFATAASARGGPVLGWAHAFPNGKGFGVVTPRHVFLGGDPTGDVTGVRWHGWGGTKSTGFGTGWCPGRSVAAGYHCSVSLHAFDLGRCHRRRAYRMLKFYFKFGPHRRWTFGSKWNACTGQ
jgi:hypothetical protein